MFERFTVRAREVVVAARRHAVRTTSGEVRPEHLLMALLDDRESLAATVLAGLGAEPASLREALDRTRGRYVDGLDDDDAEALKVLGIDLDDVVRRIDRNLSGGSAPGPSVKRIPFSRSAKKVLELSLREAVRIGHNYIGTEHILLALSRCDDRVVADTLAAEGLTRPALREAVVEAVRRAG